MSVQPAKSVPSPTDRPVVTLPRLQAKKEAGTPITVLTAYDATTARQLDAAGVDILLVGDSLAMTILGHPNTLSVTMDEMLHHVKAVRRGTEKALLVADMPFLSVTLGEDDACRNAGRMVQEGGAVAVKVEGASPSVCAVIRRLVSMGIPVMGHLGLTPQAIHTLGGFKVQGKTPAQAAQLFRDALTLQACGVFSVVLELVPTEVAAVITQALTIPTIGIGAGPECDGQVLVIGDILGRYTQLSPRFVRKYADMATGLQQAVIEYCNDVTSKTFPNSAESFTLDEAMKETILNAMQAVLEESNLCDSRPLITGAV